MGPYQRTPRWGARAIRYSGLGVRSVGPVGDFLRKIGNKKSPIFFGFWLRFKICCRLLWGQQCLLAWEGKTSVSLGCWRPMCFFEKPNRCRMENLTVENYTHAWLHVWFAFFPNGRWVRETSRELGPKFLWIHRLLFRGLYKLPITWYTIYPLPSRSGNEIHKSHGLCLSWAFMNLQPWMTNKSPRNDEQRDRTKVRIEHRFPTHTALLKMMIFLFPKVHKKNGGCFSHVFWIHLFFANNLIFAGDCFFQGIGFFWLPIHPSPLKSSSQLFRSKDLGPFLWVGLVAPANTALWLLKIYQPCSNRRFTGLCLMMSQCATNDHLAC